jgi:pimeloyl-ACP methyl ester carboxylesterase
VFAATPQAIRPEDAVRTLSSTVSLLTEISTRIRQDERVIAGLTRVYNAIARVPSLARRSLDFMLRQAPSDLASIDTAFSSLALGEWVRLIANKAARASIDEVAHLHSDWVKNLQQLSRPMRFFHGAEDTLCPIEDAKAMACDLRNAQFTTFQGAGHLVLGQRLDAILGALFVPQNANDSVTEQSV